jgi:phenylacetate-CoA oxygenase PaaI subunit
VIDAGRDALRATLVALSDSKLLLGYHYGEWTFGPPAIEAGIAACSMAQEEFGHARLLNGLLKREFELEIDPLADTRPSEAMAGIAYLDRPFENWADLVAANVAVDHALSLELSGFQEGWEPLARVVPKMLLEEKFHYAHAEGWVRLIEAEGGEARSLLDRALARALRDAAAFFGPPGHDAELVGSGLKRIADDELRQRLFRRVTALLTDPAAAGLARANGAWDLAEPPKWGGWRDDRRRIAAGGPEQAMLDELRGTKNVAFKTA